MIAEVSRPGQIQLDVPRLFRIFRLQMMIGPVGALIFTAGMLALAKPPLVGWAAVAMFALSPVYMTWMMRLHFRRCDLLAGRVISVKPLLIASITDLRKRADGPEYGCLAVTVAPIAMFDGQAPQIGQPCPVVTAYKVVVGGPHWELSEVQPVPVASGDPDVLAGALARLSEHDFAKLDHALAHCNPTTPGIWRVDLSEITGGTCGWPQEVMDKPI